MTVKGNINPENILDISFPSGGGRAGILVEFHLVTNSPGTTMANRAAVKMMESS